MQPNVKGRIAAIPIVLASPPAMAEAIVPATISPAPTMKPVPAETCCICTLSAVTECTMVMTPDTRKAGRNISSDKRTGSAPAELHHQDIMQTRSVGQQAFNGRIDYGDLAGTGLCRMTVTPHRFERALRRDAAFADSPLILVLQS